MSTPPDGTSSTVPDSTVPPSTSPPDSISETTVSEPTVPPTTEPEAEPPGDTTTITTTITTTVDDDAAMRPSAPPQVRSSDIPVGSIILAVFVLAGVGLASYLLARRSPGVLTSTQAPGPTDTARPGDDTADDPGRHGTQTDNVTLDFLLGLGESLIDAGDAASHVESTLRTVARVNGIADIGVFVLPTALIVSLPGESNVTTEVSAAGRAPLRLDQIDDVLGLVQEAERGDIGAVDGQRRLTQIRSSAHPYLFATAAALLGYVCSTVGLAVILRATWREVVLAVVLGGVIGSFRLSTRPTPARRPSPSSR